MNIKKRYEQTPLYRIMLIVSILIIWAAFGYAAYWIIDYNDPFMMFIAFSFGALGMSVGTFILVVGITALIGYISMDPISPLIVFEKYNNWLLKTFGFLKKKYKKETIDNLKGELSEI